MSEEQLTSQQTYHRLESPTQTPLDALKQEQSLQIWGRAPRGSEIAKVQAYVGKLPQGRRGVEFTTNEITDSGSPPGYAFRRDPSETITVNEDSFAILSILTLKNCQQ